MPPVTPSIDPSAFVHPRATVADGAELVRSIAGEGATIEPGAKLFETVVWPNATARGSLTRAVVTPFGTVDVRG